MYVCTCVLLCIMYVCVCMYNMCVCMYLCVCIYVCMYYVCMMCVCMYVCVHVCAYMCACVNVCMYVYIYICIQEFTVHIFSLAYFQIRLQQFRFNYCRPTFYTVPQHKVIIVPWNKLFYSMLIKAVCFVTIHLMTTVPTSGSF
jgi:hypothetical protein